MASTEHSSNLLVVIIDIESLLTGLKLQHGQHNSIDINFVIASLATFATTYALMNRDNRLCIIAFTSYGVEFILPSKELMSQSNQEVDFKVRLHELHSILQETIPLVIHEFLGKEHITPENIKANKRERSMLSFAVSTAITLVHRQRQLCNVESRILLLHFDKEVPHNYNALMNCIFR